MVNYEAPEGYTLPDDLPNPKDLLKPNDYAYMQFDIGHKEFVVPYEQGMKIIENFRNVEALEDAESYSSRPTKVRPMPVDWFKIRVVSQDDYLKWKFNALLMEEQ